MLENFRKTLETFKQATYSEIGKCEFRRQEVEFLGSLINKDGVKPGLRKVNASKTREMPKNAYDIRRILDLTSFFRIIIPKGAMIAKPLSMLIKQNTISKWELEQKTLFENLKIGLTSGLVKKSIMPDCI